MDVFELMVASLVINVCVLLVVIATWVVRRRPATGDGGGDDQKQLNSGYDELDVKAASLISDDHLNQKTSVVQDAHHSNTMEVYIMSSIITSSFCFISGLYLTASPYVWEYPFVGTHHGDMNVVTPSESNRLLNHDIVWSGHEATSTVLLSATFGCFIFALFHLAFACNRSRAWCLWTVFRAGYLFITLLTFFAIINTKENLLGASLILLMEVDAAIEGVCQLIDTSPIGKHVRTPRIILSVVGCVTSVATRIVLTWTMCILLAKTFNPIAMSVLSLGISSFGFIFYQAFTLLVIKKHVEQLRAKFDDTDAKKLSKRTAIEPYQEKFRGRGSQVVAFHLMNERLIEISTYAKTVAGAITGKKLKPLENLCDNFGSIKPGHQSAITDEKIVQ